MISYLDTLNPEQRAAVEYTEGPQLVIAGAGSGKTRVLTCKIAYLLEKGLPPWSIMALTFTNKAAGEMRERVAAMVGDAARHLYMGTFHSVFARLLRREAALLGFTPNYTIYDEADSRAVVGHIVKDWGLDTPPYKPAGLHDIISKAKNKLIDAEQYAHDKRAIELDDAAGRPKMSRIYAEYTERLRRSNAMDFDDLLLLTYQLFSRFPDVRQRYASNFRYILVDEYQDTNHAQHCIVQMLSEKHHRVCVVGDDAQSIYAFRGADIDNILGFNKALDGAKLFKLERNYRSTQCIVDAANSLIKKNRLRIDKTVVSQNMKGEPLSLVETWSDTEEAIAVRKRIQKIKRQDGCRYEDFAILYRTNVQSRKFEEELRKQSIPYMIYGGLGFYQRKEIKDLIAYFRLMVNPSDEEAFLRVVNFPARGIGNTTVSKLTAAASANGVSLISVAAQPERYGLSASKATLSKLKDFAAMVSEFAERAESESAEAVGKDIAIRSGIVEMLKADGSVEGETRRENVEELIGSLRDFVARQQEEDRRDQTGMGFYLQEVALMTDADKNVADTDCVRLMTIHSAKGLEFATVFVVGLEENLFPSEKSRSSARAMEEERRLFYVAITRAKLHCILTYANSRYMYGVSKSSMPSRFISDIDPQYIECEGNTSSPRPHVARREPFGHSIFGTRMSGRPTVSPGMRLLRTQAEAEPQGRQAETTVIDTLHGSVRVGTRIIHERFGRGRVSKIEGAGENAKISVDFDNSDPKVLLVKFARFRIDD